MAVFTSQIETRVLSEFCEFLEGHAKFPISKSKLRLLKKFLLVPEMQNSFS